MIINGTNANDQITGTGSADIINARNGNDTVGAGGGNDLIQGGNGNDSVNAGAGNDIILGGNGNDTLLGGAGNDLIAGENGDDIIDGGAGTDIVSGGNGNDILIYRVSENVDSVDIYDGGKGQDSLRLVVTQEFANSASFRSDLAAIQALIARYGSANYAFSSFDLAVVSIEKVEVVIEGPTNHAPVAVADIASLKEDVTAVASGSLLANDTDADNDVLWHRANGLMLAPVLVAMTVVVLASGIALMVVGHRTGLLLQIHKVSFVVWGATFAVHFLAYLPRALRALRHAGVPGARRRIGLVLGSLAAGVVLAVALLPVISDFHRLRF